jgi:hypothetical protein
MISPKTLVVLFMVMHYLGSNPLALEPKIEYKPALVSGETLLQYAQILFDRHIARVHSLQDNISKEVDTILAQIPSPDSTTKWVWHPAVASVGLSGASPTFTQVVNSLPHTSTYTKTMIDSLWAKITQSNPTYGVDSLNGEFLWNGYKVRITGFRTAGIDSDSIWNIPWRSIRFPPQLFWEGFPSIKIPFTLKLQEWNALENFKEILQADASQYIYLTNISSKLKYQICEHHPLHLDSLEQIWQKLQNTPYPESALSLKQHEVFAEFRRYVLECVLKTKKLFEP